MYLKCWTQLNVQPPLNASLLKSAIPGSQKSCTGDYLTLVGVCVLSCLVVSDSFASPWTAALQDPLFMGFFRQEYRSGLPFPPPGDLADPGSKPEFPAWQADSLPLSHWGSPSSGNK